MKGVYNSCRSNRYPEIYAGKQKEHVVHWSLKKLNTLKNKTAAEQKSLTFLLNTSHHMAFIPIF